MQYLKSLLIFALFFNIGCVNNEPNQDQLKPLDFDQAIEMAKQYLDKSGYNKIVELEILNEPDNATWAEYSSGFPKMIEDYGLKNKSYFAIYFIEHVRDGGAIVFVDKDQKEVIGALFGNHFEANMH